MNHNKSCREKFTRHPPPPPPQPQQRSGRSLLSKLACQSLDSVSTGRLTVKITLALLGDAAATLILIDLEDLDLGEGLHDLAVDAAGGGNVVGGTAAAVLGAAVDPETLNQVQVITADGQRIPLSAIAHYENSLQNDRVSHEGQFASESIAFDLAPGVTLEQGTAAIERAVAKLGLPEEVIVKMADNGMRWPSAVITCT